MFVMSNKQNLEIMKTAICKITFDGYDWRNEVSIQSPSGKTIYFNAVNMENLSNEAQNLLRKWNGYWKSAKFGTGIQRFQESLSYEILEEFLDYSLGK